jgi:hypothetical protein
MNSKSQLIFSTSLLCLLVGCTSANQATLEIRSIDNPQLAVAGERSIERGKVLLRRGQNADAISAFRAALREEPDSAEAHNGLAVAYDGIGRKDLARRYFELAVAEKPDEVRYRSNLANFFEGNGQSELAAGLRDEPITLASAELAELPPVSVAIADMPVVLDVVDVPGVDPIDAILADLSTGTVDQEILAAVVETSPLSDQRPEQSVPAVFRPSVTPAIKAAEITLPSIPKPDRSPLDRRPDLVADIPRHERRQPESTGPYIERMSLGEVKLVTLPQSPKDHFAFDLDQLGGKLAMWAADEARQAAFVKAPGLKGRLAIQNAIERAAIDEAIASAASLAELAQQFQSDFVYIAYDDSDSATAETDA